MGFLAATSDHMSTEDAIAVLDSRTNAALKVGLSERFGVYFDYLRGRVMKLKFKVGEPLDFGLYDRDNGTGAGARAVAGVVS